MTYDMTDQINLLHLALNGQPQNALYSSVKIAPYLEYIRELTRGKFHIKDDLTNLSISKQWSRNSEFLSRFELNTKANARELTFTENQMLTLIQKIKDSKDDYELTSDEFDFVYGSSSSEVFNLMMVKFVLPKLHRVTSQTDKYVNEIRKYAREDDLFKYTIENVYKVDYNRKRDFSMFKHSKRCVHGTKNLHLLSILSEGFKLSSELRHRTDFNVSFSGNSLGDGVYFARQDQISKSMAYLSSEEKTRYIVIADLHYNDVYETYEHVGTELTGFNMIHAIKQGLHSRDELVVLPRQIEIQYVLELRHKSGI